MIYRYLQYRRIALTGTCSAFMPDNTVDLQYCTVDLQYCN